LSGLNAAAADLQVTGNNIANANTTGFKESRAEFADVYAVSLSGLSQTQAGMGVRVSNVAQQFNQGNLERTESNLDLAIEGQGFFSLSSDPLATTPTLYTRAGEFKVDNEGFVVSNQGDHLLSFAPEGGTVEEGFNEGVFQPLKITTTQGEPVATSQITAGVNLDATQVKPANAPVDPNDPASYNHTSSVKIYDSLGNSHIASTYYVTEREAGVPNTANNWQAYLFIDGVAFNTDGSKPPSLATHNSYAMDFNDSGELLTTPGTITYPNIDLADVDPGLSVAPLNLTFNFSDSTQYSSEFSVQNLSQDGLPVGTLTGIDINDEGVVFARFSNGGSDILGKVALTRFVNPQGLTKAGDTSWQESIDSGTSIPGQAGTGSFGLIQSGAVESSNVDLSEQLVHLIIAQQTYQANAQSITTEKEVVQTVLNI